MAKTKEELNELKQEYQTITTKLIELSEDELEYIVGGNNISNIQINIPGLEAIGPAPILGKSVNVNEVLTSTNPNSNNKK